VIAEALGEVSKQPEVTTDLTYLDIEGVYCYWTAGPLGLRGRWWFHATPPTIREILEAEGLQSYFDIINRHVLVSQSNFDTTDLGNMPLPMVHEVMAALVAIDQHVTVMSDGSCHRK
jgi:hypothetical protein